MCDGDRQNIESVLGGHSLAEAASSIQVPCLHFLLNKWNSKRALDICKVRLLVGAPPLWGGDSALQGSPTSTNRAFQELVQTSHPISSAKTFLGCC